MGKIKILATGATSFLASHLCEKLQNLHHKVTDTDNMIGGIFDNHHKIIEFHELDCCDFHK